MLSGSAVIQNYIWFIIKRKTVTTITFLSYTGWPAKKYQIFPGHDLFINWVRNLKQISLESVYFEVCLWYTTIFPKYHLPLQYKSRADLQSSWLHAGEHRERWTLWLQPPSALDFGYSMVLTQILFVSRATKGKNPKVKPSPTVKPSCPGQRPQSV